MAALKHPFLICYDYGTGGLWGIMLARSEAEILKQYPELLIVHERPKWMDDSLFERIMDTETHDIDGAPWGLLNAVIGDRRP
jgi:hypothetical protein